MKKKIQKILEGNTHLYVGYHADRIFLIVKICSALDLTAKQCNLVETYFNHDLKRVPEVMNVVGLTQQARDRIIKDISSMFEKDETIDVGPIQAEMNRILYENRNGYFVEIEDLGEGLANVEYRREASYNHPAHDWSRTFKVDKASLLHNVGSLHRYVTVDSLLGAIRKSMVVSA